MSDKSLRSMIEKSGNIVFFGGAGVSTESGIPDFRSDSGIYTAKINYGFPPEELLSRSFFDSNTKVFFDYYKNHMIHKDAKPNGAHLALAELERLGHLRAVITQNIDGLHQTAGSKNVLELHGSIHRNYCVSCHKFFDLDYIINSNGVPICDKCGGTVKPDVVLYEEQLNAEVLRKAAAFIAEADVLIVAGTSLVVYPAAGLLKYYSGSKLILINKSPTQYDSYADLLISDSVGKVLSEAVFI